MLNFGIVCQRYINSLYTTRTQINDIMKQNSIRQIQILVNTFKSIHQLLKLTYILHRRIHHYSPVSTVCSQLYTNIYQTTFSQFSPSLISYDFFHKRVHICHLHITYCYVPLSTYISTFLFDDTFDEGVVKTIVVSGLLADVGLYLTATNFFVS